MDRMNLLSADTLKKDIVQNRAGEKIGKIEDFMINLDSGEIQYAVLSFGGFLGVGDKLLAIPWQALQLDRAEKVFTLDVEKKVLESSPGFDKDHWPSFADASFIHKVNHHFNGVGSYTYNAQ